MSDPTEETQKDQEIREGTETLQEIADEVEAEREQAGTKTSLPSDEAEESVTAVEGETREDHLSHDDDADPLAGENEEVRMGNYGKLSNRGGGPQG